MKTMNEIFSHNLRNMLYAKNRTQVELAKAVKVSETSVSHWVNGDVVPRPKKVDEICAYLKCSREDLTIDHEQVAVMAPEDVLAEELRGNPKLFRLMFYAVRLSPAGLDDMYLMGNIEKGAYTAKSADLQRKIAELERQPAPKQHSFTAGWKEVYLKLDQEHRRAFWRGLIAGVEVDADGNPVKILY